MTEIPKRILLLAACLPFAALAHHSRLEFERGELIEIEGEVVNVFWRNPHIQFQVRTDDGAVWVFEGADLVSLNRRGLPSDMLQVGDRVKAAGSPSNRRDNFMDVSNLLLPNGTEAVFRPRTQARWSDTYVGFAPEARLGSTRGASDAARIVAAEGPGLFRTWQFAGVNMPELSDLPYTDAALAEQAEYDMYVDDPLIACEPPGMPRAMTFAGPHPIEFLEGEDEITIRMEYFNHVRTIHMNAAAAADAAGQPATLLGYSVGHWEGNSLVVRTTRIDYPYVDLFQPLLGFPQSEEVEIIERFTLSETDNRLIYDITIIDPVTLTEPMVLDEYLTMRWEPETRVEDYTCYQNESFSSQQ